MAEFDVIVVGGGAAGSRAALAAASAGLKVALFDENDGVEEPLDRAGVDGVAAGTVTSFSSHAVWSVTGEYRVDAVGPHGTVHCKARALIVACGATELVVPFEGWTSPGVITPATFAKLLRSQRLQGRTTLVAGCGPWLAAVAAQTIECGGEVEAIVDLGAAAEWGRARAAMSGRPDLLVQRLSWWRTIRAAGTPRYGRSALVRVEPLGQRLRATLARCNAAGEALDTVPTILLADCIVVCHGFIPATEITRLLRARHCYSPQAGGWIAVADEDGRTSRSMLYVAGDAAGIAGEEAAATHGELVGLACAFDLAAPMSLQLRRRLESARREHQRSAVLGRAMVSPMALSAARLEGISAETIVCRCEDVTRAEIDAACDEGAHDMNQLKAWTRCGMGPCQGRMCADVAAQLLMQRVGASRESVGCFTARTPLRPVTVEALTGDFEYADIAIPQAAPL
jgi:bacterioferritin-associated ferredoxin